MLGGLILAWPGTSILVPSTLFGGYLLLSGFAGAAMAVRLCLSLFGIRVMLFISGVLSVILAVLCFRNFGDPYPVLLLSIWIGVSFSSKASRSSPWRSVIRAARPRLVRGSRGLVGDRRRCRARLAMGFDLVLTLTAGVWLVLMGLVEIVWGLQMRNDSKNVREVENVVRERFGKIKQAS